MKKHEMTIVQTVVYSALYERGPLSVYFFDRVAYQLQNSPLSAGRILQELFHLHTAHFSSFFHNTVVLSHRIKYWPNSWSAVFCFTRHSVNTEALPLTLTARFGSVPLRSLAAAHDTCQSGVALEQVASFTIKCHHRAQLVVRTHSCSIHHIARIETRFS